MIRKVMSIISIFLITGLSLWFFSGVFAAPDAVTLDVIIESTGPYDPGETVAAAVAFQRSEGSGEAPFLMEIYIPSGLTLVDVKGEFKDVKPEELTVKDNLIIWEGDGAASAGLRANLQLKVDACPGGGTSCKVNLAAQLTDAKGQSLKADKTLEIEVPDEVQPLNSEDLAIIFTDEAGNPITETSSEEPFLINVRYERTPNSGVNPFGLEIKLPENIIMIGEIKLDEFGVAESKLIQEDGFIIWQGVFVEEVSRAQPVQGFNIGMPPTLGTICPQGEGQCPLEILARLTDGTGQEIKTSESISLKIPPPEMSFNTQLKLAGAEDGLRQGDQFTALLELSSQGGQEGEPIMLQFLLPNSLALNGEADVQAINAEVGDPTIGDGSIMFETFVGVDGLIQIKVPLVAALGCEEDDPTYPECKDFTTLKALKADQSTASETETPFLIFPQAQPNEETIDLGLEIVQEDELTPLKPGDSVFVHISAARANGAAPAPFGFLLEVSGLKYSGNATFETENAGPEKITSPGDVPALKWEGEIGGTGNLKAILEYTVDACENGTSCTVGARTAFSQDGKTIGTRELKAVVQDDSSYDPELVDLAAGVIVWEREFNFDETEASPAEIMKEIKALPTTGTCLEACEAILLGMHNENEVPVEIFWQIGVPNTLKASKSAYLGGGLGDENSTLRFKYLIPGQEFKTVRVPFEITQLIEDGVKNELAISYCVQPEGSDLCSGAEEEERFLQLFLIIIMIFVGRDHADAPTSQNHAGVVMEAYGPGTASALFPVSRDPAVLSPFPNTAYGPAHQVPWQYKLGDRVSLETDVDRGLDLDFAYNIDPAANDPDNDRYDDGVDIGSLVFENCQPATIPVEITIQPSAVSHFSNSGGQAYINIWLDTDRNGRWDNGVGLCGGSTSDHIAIDYPVDIVALGAGTHVINVATDAVEWPSAFELDTLSRWMRVMLSDRESNKDTYITHGDGRGDQAPYYGGETEDYLYVPPAAPAANFAADMEIDVDIVPIGPGTITSWGDVPNLQGRQPKGEMVIKFRNKGNGPAEDIELEVQLTKVTDIVHWEVGCPPLCDLEPEAVELVDPSNLKVTIPGMGRDEFGTLTLGWTGCLTCVRSIEDAAAIDQLAFVRIKSKANTTDFSDIVSLKWPPIERFAPDFTLGWHGCLTCVRSIDVGSEMAQLDPFIIFNLKAEPGAEIIILKDGEPMVTDIEMFCNAEGKCPIPQELYEAVTLEQGLHSYTAAMVDPTTGLWGRPPSKPLVMGCVDDIVDGTLMFRNSETGQVWKAPANDRYANQEVSYLKLKTGVPTDIQVNYCGDDPQPTLTLQVGSKSILLSQISGTVYGAKEETLEFPGRRQGENGMTLIVESGSTLYEKSYLVEEADGSRVVDAASGAAVSGAEVTVLVEQEVAFNDTLDAAFVAWDGTGSGISNPLMTGSDGSLTIPVENGSYQLYVAKEGYQPYRSGTIEVTDGQLSTIVSLVPVEPGSADHVIGIDESGFLPGSFEVAAGDIVMFVNYGSQAHGVSGDGWSSGLLANGGSFKRTFETTGTFELTDPGNINALGVVTVAEGSSSGDGSIFLPMIMR